MAWLLSRDAVGNFTKAVAVEFGKENMPREERGVHAHIKPLITQWIINWKRNGWQTAAKKPVKNVDLWTDLDNAMKDHDVEWRWVKGHAGHPENERADGLARSAVPR